MRCFIKISAIFVHFFLALFIWSSGVDACENITLNTTQQYFSSLKPETTLINNKKEEYYLIFDNRNRVEITNRQDKNDGLSFGSFYNPKFDYNIANGFISENTVNSTFISDKISLDLKNTIYTRAP